MTYWLISDTHFGEERILGRRNRPFESLEEMNESLIYRWNTKIKSEDRVFHLGNFGYHTSHYLQNILSQLQGKITLIQAEEDRSLEKLFLLDFVCICHGIHLDYKNYHFYLTSSPSTEMLYTTSSNFINVYGSVYPGKKIHFNKINMNCDYWDFSPVMIDDVIMEYKLNNKKSY